MARRGAMCRTRELDTSCDLNRRGSIYYAKPSARDRIAFYNCCSAADLTRANVIAYGYIEPTSLLVYALI